MSSICVKKDGNPRKRTKVLRLSRKLGKKPSRLSKRRRQHPVPTVAVTVPRVVVAIADLSPVVVVTVGRILQAIPGALSTPTNFENSARLELVPDLARALAPPRC